jgi:competence protein ComEC
VNGAENIRDEQAKAPERTTSLWLEHISTALEDWLEQERDQLPLLIPVGVAIGILIWEKAGGSIFLSLIAICSGFFLFALLIGRKTRLSAIFFGLAATVLAGFAAIALKSAFIATPVLDHIWIGSFYGRITSVEPLAARDIVRLELETAGYAELPPKVRVNLDTAQYRADFLPGAVVLMRARLMPPAGPALPGGYDFARRAWFSGVGATGSALGQVKLYKASSTQATLADTRYRLSDYIIGKLPPGAGPMGAALLIGGQGAISVEDAQAMRDSGMAHLLSVSGLHVTAIVGGAFFLISSVLALFPWVALRISVPLTAAVGAAFVAVGYTLLSGSEIPTIRSCVAALMILLALALGRDALSLRMVAAGSVFILLFWPDALAGPSFQLSFAAVATIIVLHDLPWMRALRAAPEASFVMRWGWGIVSLLLTGFAIELALAPIALFHFHKTGLYGALANVVAIPLTTFYIMPLEVLGLTADIAGLGAPFWWAAGQGVRLLIGMAHGVQSMPGSVAMLPSMPNWAFAAMIAGLLWAGIFRTKWRVLGVVPFCVGALAMLLAPRPDVLITGDGKHLALVDDQGRLALLRDRAGEYVRGALSETAGISVEAMPMDAWPGAECSPDMCIITIDRNGRRWTLLATRTRYLVPIMEMAAACKRVDIVISDRYLPYACKPRWFKADRGFLAQTGGMALYLTAPRVESVNGNRTHLPWFQKPVENGFKSKAIIQKERF